MRKLNVEATDENVLNSIKYDDLLRTEDISNFISILEGIDYNAFISLDAKWGDGKTFFVRQIEMTLKYHNDIIRENSLNGNYEDAFNSNNTLKNLELNKLYLPIYFNAWLYDNHSDPLMALLFVAVKQCQKNINTKISTSVKEKFYAVMDSLPNNKITNWANLAEKFAGKDMLDEICLLEDVKENIKSIFNDILVERGEKLVIFIDELDRCRPTFTVELLERIKHFFDDDRIIFVMSVNKSQLVYTIENFYGRNFDASAYLNKFFDINIQLPPANTRGYFEKLDISCNSSYYILNISNELQKYYKLSLRDTTQYFQKMTAINVKGINYNRIELDAARMIQLVVPIICILDIVDVKSKIIVLEGNGIDILKKIIEEISFMKEIVTRLSIGVHVSEPALLPDEKYISRIEIFEKYYINAFKHGCYDNNLDCNIKEICLKLCNIV